MAHRNVRLTVHGRRLLIERVRSGRPAAHVAAERGISRTTAHQWVRRWRAEGEVGLHDRPSRPRTTPHRDRRQAPDRPCRQRCGPTHLGPVVRTHVRTTQRSPPFPPSLVLSEAVPERHYTHNEDRGAPRSAPAVLRREPTTPNVAEGMSVLEVGTGSGHSGALLSYLVGPDGQVTMLDMTRT